ncbi:UNVERIFIED_CONTAM: hypothetical protein Scaly_0259500 [Sesamum calycinum]|uniref:Uncharacterized protein n=1 Tax=Sesamum calycinum TaxID=2727403 RepID=A0AAW2S9C5_9LAMI
MLYWKDDIDLDYCKFCGEVKYKPTRERNSNRKKILYFILRYLPLTPRLQMMYISKANAEQMTWHANNQTEEGYMCHPFDVEAWKHFDRTYCDFAVELCNVRLGLCTDGFAPHGQYGSSPSNPKCVIDVYLEALNKELQNLWHVGVLAYDNAKNKNGRKACYFDCNKQFLPRTICTMGTRKPSLRTE